MTFLRRAIAITAGLFALIFYLPASGVVLSTTEQIFNWDLSNQTPPPPYMSIGFQVTTSAADPVSGGDALVMRFYGSPNGSGLITEGTYPSTLFQSGGTLLQAFTANAIYGPMLDGQFSVGLRMASGTADITSFKACGGVGPFCNTSLGVQGTTLTTTSGGIPASERAVLINLYNSTNGANWTNNAGWMGAAGTECTWYGVSCAGAQSHVVGIYLSDNNMVGVLPSLTGLTALQIFYVEFNQLTGPIPSLNGLTALQHFLAYNNQLTGSIPALDGLTALDSFAVSTNQLTGSIPSLSGLTALRYFTVWNNRLTGSIPSLNGLTSLQNFDVSSNQLTGSIPSINSLTALLEFAASGNLLTGSIPSLTGLTSLGYFSVFNNQLSGSIPELRGLSALREFWAVNNKLTGSIPSLNRNVSMTLLHLAS